MKQKSEICLRSCQLACWREVFRDMRSVRNRITRMPREEESGSDTILQSLRNYLKDAKPRHYTEDENFVVRQGFLLDFLYIKLKTFS